MFHTFCQKIVSEKFKKPPKNKYTKKAAHVSKWLARLYWSHDCRLIWLLFASDKDHSVLRNSK